MTTMNNITQTQANDVSEEEAEISEVNDLPEAPGDQNRATRKQ